MTWGRQNSEIEGHQQMDFALDNGVNFLIRQSYIQYRQDMKNRAIQKDLLARGLKKMALEKRLF